MQARTLIAAAAVAATASFASAGNSYSFDGVSNNSVIDTGIAEAQLSVDVTDSAGNALFKFINAGPLASSIVQIYWDDNAGVLSSLDSWSTTTPTTGAAPFGVDFSGGSANPGNLPAGNPIGFSADYSIQPKNQGGKSKNGVGTGEDVSISFSMAKTYADLIAALDDGSLKIGVHMQAFKGGGSESLVTGTPPTTGVPTPTAAFAGLGLLGLIGARRRRRA